MADQSNFMVMVLFMLVVLRVGVICGAAWLFIPRRRCCPHCSRKTMRLVSPAWMEWVSLEKRWCTCGWAGWSKQVRPQFGDGDGELPPVHPSPAGAETPEPIRSLPG